MKDASNFLLMRSALCGVDDARGGAVDVEDIASLPVELEPKSPDDDAALPPALTGVRASRPPATPKSSRSDDGAASAALTPARSP